MFYKNEEYIGSAKIIETPLSLFDLKYKSSIVNTDHLLRKDYLIKKIWPEKMVPENFQNFHLSCEVILLFLLKQTRGYFS